MKVKIMKKHSFYQLFCAIFLILCSASLFADQPSFLKSKMLKRPATPTEQLLAEMKKFVQQKRTEKIAELEKSQDPKKREKAEKLKQRTRIDHIKIIREGKNSIYLQLEHSTRGLFFIEGRYYPFDAQELEATLQTLLDENINPLQENTDIDVYKSEKKRMHPIFGRFYLSDDLYSAAIFLDKEKKTGHRRGAGRFYRRMRREIQVRQATHEP